MERFIMQKLIDWKNSPYRKPLLLRGARQVGKTYLLLKFGKEQYDNVVYIHFEGNTEKLERIFAPDLDPKRIIDELSAYARQTILPGKTLIFFDEIQASERALTSLKYFCEEANEYHIVAAGSLLGLAVNRGNFSFPVGKVDFLTLYPLSFEEFLYATGNQLLAEKIRGSYESFSPMPDVYHDAAMGLYHQYLVIGGYPAVIDAYLGSKDYFTVQAQQSNVCNAYTGDMNKYASTGETIKSMAVYNSLPSQLGRENTKFRYSAVKSNARAKDYELSLQWLKTADVVLENIKVTEGKLPLRIYEQADTFKLYYSDVGLLCFRSGIQPNDILVNTSLSDRARGLLAENYVAQQLVSKGHTLHYWESNGTAEIDFVIRLDDDAIPLEVKSGDNTRSKSLKTYCDKYRPKYAIRISSKNFGYENNIKSIPLYAVFCI